MRHEPINKVTFRHHLFFQYHKPRISFQSDTPKSIIYQPVSPTTELYPYFQHKQNQYITQGTTVNTPVIYHNQGIIKDLSLQDTFVFQDYTLQLMLVTNRSTSRRSYTFHPDKPSCNHLQSYIRMIPFAQLPFANQSTSHRGIIPLL